MRLIQKVLAVAQRAFCILVDRQHDGLDVLVTIAFPSPYPPGIGKRLNPGRVIGRVVVPLKFGHHRRPPRTLPLVGPG